MNKRELTTVCFVICLLASCAPIVTTSTPDKRDELISYTIYVDGGDELINCLEGYGQPNFILYDDGQLVVYRNKQYLETVLLQEEVNSLLNAIESTGILGLGENEDEGFERLIIKGKVYHFFRSNFPNAAIEKTINIIEQFQPPNLVPYIPKNLVLWIYPVESLAPFEESLPRPVPQVKDWSSELKPLSKFHIGFRDMSGDMLPTIMKQFNGFPDYQIFKEGNNLSITAICANFDGYGSYLPSNP